MLNKKDKYCLRSLANPLKPLVIIGKEGLSENIVQSIRDAIKVNELIKISLLKTYEGLPCKQLGELLASTIDGEFIYSVGRVIVLYKKNKDINRYGVQ